MVVSIKVLREVVEIFSPIFVKIGVGIMTMDTSLSENILNFCDINFRKMEIMRTSGVRETLQSLNAGSEVFYAERYAVLAEISSWK
jgi:hypothetical protein